MIHQEQGAPLQLGLQTGPGAQHRGHHVISDGEVLWEVATAADQDRVEAIQELGGEEGVLLPVFQRVLSGWGLPEVEHPFHLIQTLPGPLAVQQPLEFQLRNRGADFQVKQEFFITEYLMLRSRSFTDFSSRQ